MPQFVKIRLKAHENAFLKFENHFVGAHICPIILKFGF